MCNNTVQKDLVSTYVADDTPITYNNSIPYLVSAIFANGTSKFKLGNKVKKRSGSEWVGTIVGWYSTSLTPEGYAVESETHKGSVQIYPASALELV